jgi:hypothetical protein
MPLTYLFDLDMTLIDSSALAMLRKSGLWQEVRRNMHLVRPFPKIGRHAPHEVPQVLKDEGHTVGVVTSSPRGYAEEVLGRFRIPYDVLVAYGDTENHKPNPDPILEAIRQLGAQKASTLYVGDDVGDVEAAYHAGIRSVGVGWGPTSLFEMSSTAPDIYIEKPGILARTELLPGLGYVAECISDNAEFAGHWGSVLRSDDNPPVFALGRYFPTADPRHATSALSANILRLKNDDAIAPTLGRAFGLALSPLDWAPKYIVPVPPKPSQPRNRFAELLKAAARHLPRDSVTLDGLKCIKEIEGYKQMNALDRQEAIRGAFKSNYNWNGTGILLLDDVYTTGETVKECARVLARSGAGEVRIVTLGKDQRAFLRKQCSACHRPMRVRTNSHTGDKFWGCSGYPNQCQHTENL